MNDIDVILSIPVSPVYISALVLFNGKSRPNFVNHTITMLNLNQIKYILPGAEVINFCSCSHAQLN